MTKSVYYIEVIVALIAPEIELDPEDYYKMSEKVVDNGTTREINAVPVQSLLDDKWDAVLSNLVVKVGLGFGCGVVASVLLFRRRAFPVWLGLGFGAGRGYAEGDAIFRSPAGVRQLKI